MLQRKRMEERMKNRNFYVTMSRKESFFAEIISNDDFFGNNLFSK
jgi:hypothetical protein